jgi:hypothetical protein
MALVTLLNWSRQYIHKYQVMDAHRTKRKAERAEHIIRLCSAPISRMIIFTCSSKFAISGPHVILTLRLPWTLRESLLLMVIARLSSWGRIWHVWTAISNCGRRSMVSHTIQWSSLNSLLRSSRCYRIYRCLHQTNELKLGEILATHLGKKYFFNLLLFVK